MTAGLDLRRHGSVLEVVLDRSERRNALSRALLVELRQVFTGLPEDVRAVVLTSSGRVFCAGADFADLTGTSDDLAYDRDLEDACSAIRTSGVPTIAVVNGPCVGAGVELALSCDVRIAGPQAWFRVPAVELGLLYNPESIRRIHAVLPRTTITRLLVLAERLPAEDALRSGLVTHTADGDPREHASALAERLATLPQDALAATLSLLQHLDEGHYDPTEWQGARIRLMDSPARHAAVAAASARHGA